MEENKNSKKKVGIIIAIVLGVFLILGLVLFFVLSGKKVTITFDSDGGSMVEVQKIKKGSTITLPESTKEGFTLEGWYIDEQKVTSDTTFNKNTTLKARWTTSKPKSFTVTFDSREGSEVEPLEVECNNELKLPENPTKEGYVFISWVDKNETPILDGALLSCEDVTLYANWQKKEDAKKYYTVKFDSKGGSNINSIQVECNTKLKLPTTKPTRTGYEFVSWYDKNGKTILDGALLTCEDITLFADWKKIDETKEKKYYTITFDSKGGSSVASKKYECDKAISSLPTPTRSGYSFVAWYDKNGKTILNGAILGCSGNNDVVTLYADWSQDKPSTPEKQYKCPSGYTLSTDKKTCTATAEAYYVCPEGMTYSEKRGACYKWASDQKATCKNGSYFIERDDKDDICCGEEVTRLTGNQSGCATEVHGTMYNNHCCKKPEVATPSNISCPGITIYLTKNELGGTVKSGCYSMDQRTLKCPSGYTMNHTYGKCMSTVASTYE